MIPEPVLNAFGLQSKEVIITPVHIGLINRTWKLVHKEIAFILQQVNAAVFKNPEDISYNIAAIGTYLHRHKPDYFFVAPVTSIDGSELVYIQGQGYFRMFPFVAGSHTIDTVETPEQARTGSHPRPAPGTGAAVPTAPSIHAAARRSANG